MKSTILLDQKDYTKVLKGVSRYSQNHNPIVDTDRVMYDVPPTVPRIPRVGSTFYVVTDVQEHRMDLIARMSCGHDKYYWLYAGCNQIDVPFYLSRDTMLQLPPLQEFTSRGTIQA